MNKVFKNNSLEKEMKQFQEMSKNRKIMKINKEIYQTSIHLINNLNKGEDNKDMKLLKIIKNKLIYHKEDCILSRTTMVNQNNKTNNFKQLHNFISLIST